MATKISPRKLPLALETELLNITELNFTAKIVRGLGIDRDRGYNFSGFVSLLENYTMDCCVLIRRKAFPVYVPGSYLSPQILTHSE